MQAVVTQQLLATANGLGRAAAVEILIATPAVRNLIRERKGYQLAGQVQSGARFDMVTMDQNLAELVRARRISMETALEHASNSDDLRTLLGLSS